MPFVFLAFLACDKNTEIDRAFAIAYAELRIAELEYGETEDGKAIRLQILQRNGFFADVFEEKIEELKKEPKKWKFFQETLISILDSIADSGKPEEGT